jgi:hypothetical protein
VRPPCLTPFPRHDVTIPWWIAHSGAPRTFFACHPSVIWFDPPQARAGLAVGTGLECNAACAKSTTCGPLDQHILSRGDRCQGIPLCAQGSTSVRCRMRSWCRWSLRSGWAPGCWSAAMATRRLPSCTPQSTPRRRHWCDLMLHQLDPSPVRTAYAAAYLAQRAEAL